MSAVINPPANEIASKTLLSSGSLKVELLEGARRRPGVTEYSVQSGQFALEVTLRGTQLLRESTSQPWRLLPPRSFALFRGPTQLAVHVGRGDHRSLLFSWTDQETPGLARWIERTANANQSGRRFNIASFSPINEVNGDLASRLLDACDEITVRSEPAILAALHEIALHAMTSDTEFCLATLPPDLPETMKPLVEQVKMDPAASWSLKEASALAGYSPFHLSRTFKALCGFGFPEFVDRCRTELAVVQLCNTELGIEEVAQNCGFGSPQALRESVKEYLGLLPSELRIHAGLYYSE